MLWWTIILSLCDFCNHGGGILEKLQDINKEFAVIVLNMDTICILCFNMDTDAIYFGFLNGCY